MPWAFPTTFLSAMSPGPLGLGLGVKESDPEMMSVQSPEDSRNLPIHLHSSI